ncbi:hypothetical protein BS17DRAFT_822615 [Gyrodon lividus]|nr:hypothetical protein BS17DRAFT_822615 [Gyrodon lividus]
MRFTLATATTALPFFVSATPQRVKQGGTAIPLPKRSSLLNADKSVFDDFEKNTGALHPSAVKCAPKRASGGLPPDAFAIGPQL